MVSPRESSEEDSSSESEGGNLLPKIAKSTGGKRENFLEEEDIPLAEFVDRLKVGKRRLEREQEMVDLRDASDDEMSVVSDEATSVDGFMKNRKKEEERKKEKKSGERGNDSSKVNTFLRKSEESFEVK